MKLKKYQVGGAIYTPFIPAQTAAQAQGSRSSASSSSSDGKEPTSKDYAKEILKQVQENGLPSDVDAFMKVAERTLQSASILGASMLPGGGYSDFAMSDILKLQTLANRVKFNNELYKTTVSEINKNNTRSEIAIDTAGRIYALDKKTGKLETITPADLYKNKDGKYDPLTNSQLINLRATGKGVEFNSSIFEEMQADQSTNDIAKSINDLISKLGNLTIEEQTRTGIGDRIIKGAQALIAGGMDGYYSVSKSDTLKGDINAALKYIYDSLTPAQKNRLKANAVINGENPSNSVDVLSPIINQLNVTSKQEYKENLVKSDEDIMAARAKAAGSGSGSDSKTMVNNPRFFRIATGTISANQIEINLSPHSNKISDKARLVTTAIDNGPVMNNVEGTKRQRSCTLQDLKEAADFRGAHMDSGSIMIGNKVLDEHQYDGILFDEDEDSYTIDMPYKVGPQGKIVADLDSFSAAQQFGIWMHDNPNVSPGERNQKMLQLGLDPKNWDDSKKEYSFPQTRKFIAFSVIASSKNSNLDKENVMWMEKLKDTDKDKAKKYDDYFDNLATYGKTIVDGNDKKLKSKRDTAKARHLYKSWCFALLDADRAAGFMDDYVSKSLMSNVPAQIAARNLELATREELINKGVGNTNPAQF